MEKKLKSELKHLEIQRSIDEQKINRVRCEESDRMRRKADQMVLCRRMHLESAEEQMYMDIINAKEAQDRQNAELEQEQKFAQAMADLKHQEIVKIKNRQLLQNNSHELRCVEKQLRSAYGKKELLTQIKEKEVIKKEEKDREYYNDLKMNEIDNNAKKIEMESKIKNNALKIEYKNAFTQQLQEIDKKRREIFATRPPLEFGNRFKEKNNKSNLSKNDIDQFIKIKNQLKDDERKLLEEREKGIQEYLVNVEKLKKEQEEIKKEKKKEKEKCYQYLADNLISLMVDTTECGEARTNLAYEEQQNDNWLAEKEEKKLKSLQWKEMLKQNEMQLKLKKDREKKEKEKDTAEAKELLQKFQEFNVDEEKKSLEKRRMMKEYGNELKKTIDSKTDLKTKQREIKKNEFLEAVKLEEQSMALIENERKIIVERHMMNLNGVYPICSKNDDNANTSYQLKEYCRSNR